MERFTPDELQRRVDEVLFYRWDPIGINHYPQARAEYRSYVDAILEQLKNGTSRQLVDKLLEVQGYLGLDHDQELAESIASLLIEHKEAIDNGHA